MSDILNPHEAPLLMTQELFISMTGSEKIAGSIELSLAEYWSSSPNREEDVAYPDDMGALRLADLLIYAALARDPTAVDACSTALRHQQDRQLGRITRPPNKSERDAIEACHRAWRLRAKRLRAASTRVAHS